MPKRPVTRTQTQGRTRKPAVVRGLLVSSKFGTLVQAERTANRTLWLDGRPYNPDAAYRLGLWLVKQFAPQGAAGAQRRRPR